MATSPLYLNKSELSELTIKTMDILRNSSIGIYATATASNSSAVAGNAVGTAKYDIPEIEKVGNYNRDKTPNDPTVGEVQVELNQRFSTNYTFETMDLSGLTNATEIVDKIAQGSALAIVSFLDCVFIERATTDATKTAVLDLSTYAQFEAYDAVVGVANQLKTTRTTSIIGTDTQTRVWVIVSVELFTALIKDIKFSDTAAALQIEGNLTRIGGLSIVEHIFLGQDLSSAGVGGNEFTDAAVSRSANWDFSNFEGILIDREAIAIPINHFEVVLTTMELSGNPNYITKFQFGDKSIRPALIGSITKV